MSRFTKKAQSAVSKSFVTTGRDKVSVEDVMKVSPVITIIAFDKMKKGSDEFYAVTFKEDTTKFFFSGTVLTQILDTIMDGENGSCEDISKELESDGGLKVKLTQAKSERNRDYVAVEVIE